MENILCNENNDLMQEVVSAINRAVSEDIFDDYQRSGLDRQHSNSYHQLIWDHINDNLGSINNDSIIGGFSKRGFWNVYSIFDVRTGIIYSFMKEKRFFQIAKEHRKIPHYIQALASECNPNLESPQLSFFPMEPDRTESKYIVDGICNDLAIPFELIRGHKVILFQTNNGFLSGIRCCTVDRVLEIHDSVDLTHQININEAIIVEEIHEPGAKVNNPTLGLTFKEKAKKKKELNDNLVSTDKNEEKKKLSNS